MNFLKLKSANFISHFKKFDNFHTEHLGKFMLGGAFGGSALGFTLHQSKENETQCQKNVSLFKDVYEGFFWGGLAGTTFLYVIPVAGGLFLWATPVLIANKICKE